MPLGYSGLLLASLDSASDVDSNATSAYCLIKLLKRLFSGSSVISQYSPELTRKMPCAQVPSPTPLFTYMFKLTHQLSVLGAHLAFRDPCTEYSCQILIASLEQRKSLLDARRGCYHSMKGLSTIPGYKNSSRLGDRQHQE